MKASRISLVLVLLTATAFINAALAQPRAEGTSEMRQKTFEKAWRVINDKFWDPTFGGLDWHAVHERYAPQVVGVKSDKEFYALMNKMLGELKTSHMSVISPGEIAGQTNPPAIVGLGYREIDGRIMITRVLEATSASEAGLKTGFVIEKIDGDPIKDSDDAHTRLNGNPNTTVRLSYTDGNDQPHEVVLERRPLSLKDKTTLAGLSFYGMFSSKRLDGNIGYIHFSNFLDALDAQIKAAVEGMHDAPGIIIDLRGNSGGEDSVGSKLAGYFFDRETQLMISKLRRGDNFSYKSNGSKNAYQGKLVILVDAESRSASEEFSAGMQAAGRAVVIGVNTPGQDMEGDLAKLPDGSLLLYAMGQTRTPKGYVVEGHGVKPDLVVNLTRSGLLAGHDAQLDAAVEYILRK